MYHILDEQRFLDTNQSYNYDYHNLLFRIMQQSEEINHRTNTAVRAIPNQVLGYNISNCLPMINSRRMFPVTAMAELIWTLSGVKELDWLQQHTKMWDDFKNDDNQIEASYGYRWRHQFERDQVLTMIDALVKDPSDRQCVVMAWDNGKDGLGNRWTSNVPCPIGFITNIIEGKVNITLMLRSSDAIVGLPYDMMMYSLLLILVTHELQTKGLNVRYGNITAILSHVHIYQPHYEIAESLLESARTWQNLAIDSYMYSVQDLDLNCQAINWRLLNINNAIENPDTSLDLFKSIVSEQVPKIKPTHFKPEIIK